MKIYRNIVILLLYATIPLSAQTVSNIRAQQEGREIAVYYDLTERANISLGVKVDGKHVKPKLLSGDLGKHVEAGTKKRISWQVLDERDGKFQSNNVVFSVRANAPWRPFILAEGAFAPKPFQYSAGIMAGIVSRAGIYVKARSSFQFGSADGTIKKENGGYYLSPHQATYSETEMSYIMTDKQKLCHYVVDVGVIVRVAHQKEYMWYVFGGAGYGERKLLQKTKDGSWLRYEPTSYKGVNLDLGAMMAYKHFTMTLGANMILPTYTEIQIGFGYIFN